MKKNASKTNYRLDCILRYSNSDYNIYRVFNAFPLNFTSIRKSIGLYRCQHPISHWAYRVSHWQLHGSS